MKDRERGLLRHLAANIALLLLATLAILVLTAKENYARQLQQVEGYTAALGGRTAQHAADVFADKQDAIDSIAYLYGQSLRTVEAESEYLAELEQSSGFDRIRFVSSTGMSYTSTGQLADVSDRDYFDRAMRGEHGRTLVLESRYDGAQLIGFYAPVYFQGEICGVMVGFMEEQNVSDSLETDFFGHPAFTMLLDADGRALGQYGAPGMEHARGLSSLLPYIFEDERDAVEAALTSGASVSFSFNGSLGVSAGVLLPVGDTGWSLLQLFPSEAAQELAERVNRDERIALALFGVVLVLFCAQFVFLVRKKAVLAQEEESRGRMLSLLQSVSDDCLCIIDVDVASRTQEQFRLHSGDLLVDWIRGDNRYDGCIARYTESVVAPADRARFAAATQLDTLCDHLRGQKDFYIEYDGLLGSEMRHLQSRCTMSRDSAGTEHILIGVRDITESTRERIRTQTSMELIVSAASTVYPYILEENLTKNETHTVYNNGIVRSGLIEHRTMDEMIDSLRETIPDAGDYAALYDKMNRQAQLDAYAAGERLISLRVRQRGDDGLIHWMETRNILMENVAGDVCSISMTRCVDDEMARTEELRRARDAAESASRAKSTFLFNMSHDIRTPMNAIIGFSDMAQKYADDREKVVDCLQKINLSGEHLLRLINNVLDMARIESGKLTLDEHAVDIPDALGSVRCIFEADLAKKHQTLDIVCEVDDRIVFCDLLKINQIELNLIGNAIKYTPPGGHIVYSVRQIGRRDGRAHYRCSVRDNGIGMSEEFRARVFDAFEREAHGPATEGSGLGLAITKRLVEILGGTITCKSAPGRGSEFIFDFYFRPGTEADLAAQMPEQDDALDLHGRRVLLAEDNALNREISCELLQSEGLLVETAEDGDIAVEKVRASAPGYYDLVLMDIQMPRMDGFAAARAIRALPDRALASVPILALTANAFEEDRRAALNAGMNGHIAKPVDIRELRRALRTCL